MFTIFLGSLVFIVCMACNNLYLVIAVAIVAIIILLLPVEGFLPSRCVQEVELIGLKRGNTEDRVYYVERKGKKVVFAYDNKQEYDLKGTAYEERYVRGNIKIYESRDCTTPVLKKFVRKPMRLFFTVAPFSTKVQYVFQVPEGTLHNSKDRLESSSRARKMKLTVQTENIEAV